MNEQGTQLNTLFQKAKDVSLLSAEKETIHASLVSFMENNPITETTKISTAQPSPFVMNPSGVRLYKANKNTLFQLFSIGLTETANFFVAGPLRLSHRIRIRFLRRSPRASNFIHFRKSYYKKKTRMIIALLVAFGLTAGTSFAAQQTLPGDTLYPIKIHLNEGVESLVAVGAKADAEVKAKHALKRLEEAGKLNAKGRLTAEHKVEVEQRFREHVKEMDDDLHELRERGDTDTEVRVRGEFNKKAERHRKDLLVMRADGSANAEAGIDLSRLLGHTDEDRPDRDEDESRIMSSTTLRVNENRDGESETGRDGRDGEGRREREVEIRGDTTVTPLLPQLKPDSSGENRPIIDL
jgi:hypothetical protein